MGGVQGYETEIRSGEDSLKFLFISRGKSDLIKIIEYQYIQELGGSSLYNLAFGDYDACNKTLSDERISNNGDLYPVFYTVLSTIPDFFISHPKALLMVQGSDSTLDFEEGCRIKCKRKCAEKCKKLNQRILIYQRFINQNFEAFSKDYRFYGAKVIEEKSILEQYQAGQQYDAIFLRRR